MSADETSLGATIRAWRDRHPSVGEITVDCDVLSDSETDLKIVIHTAVPGSEDETKLALALVAGVHPVG